MSETAASRDVPPDPGRPAHWAAAPQEPPGQDTRNRWCSWGRGRGHQPARPASGTSSSTRRGPRGGQQRLGPARRPAPRLGIGDLQKERESPLRPQPGPAALSLSRGGGTRMTLVGGVGAGGNQEPSTSRRSCCILLFRGPACEEGPLGSHLEGFCRPESRGERQGLGRRAICTPCLAGHQRGTCSGK